MYGQNPIRPPEKGDGSTLQVQEIFPTLQGEGPHTGADSIFIRLGGCNLACSFCDTEFESFEEWSVEKILEEVVLLSSQNETRLVNRASHEFAKRRSIGGTEYADQGNKLIVITGGEPLRQNITPLCKELLAAGYPIQIETNGTLWRPLPDGVQIICSPKAPNGVYHPVRGDVLERVLALKFIISANLSPYNSVPEWALDYPVWLQPMDEGDAAKNLANEQLTMQLAERYNTKVSLQTHKIFNLD